MIKKDSKVIFDRNGGVYISLTDTSTTSKMFQYIISDNKISFFFSDAGIQWSIEKLSNKKMIIKGPEHLKGNVLISFKKIEEERF